MQCPRLLQRQLHFLATVYSLTTIALYHSYLFPIVGMLALQRNTPRQTSSLSLSWQRTVTPSRLFSARRSQSLSSVNMAWTPEPD